jgi:hypothetical protein
MNTQLNDFTVSQGSLVTSNSLGLNNDQLITVKNNLAEIILLNNGMILNCNDAGAKLLDCAPNKLTWQHVSKILPKLTGIPLVLDENVNPYLHVLSVIGHQFEMVAMNGINFSCKLLFCILKEFGNCCLRITIQPITHTYALTKH